MRNSFVELVFIDLFQVTDSHSVDVETLRKKSVESPTKSLRGSSSSSSVVNLSQVNLTDTVHPVVGPGAVTRGKQFENGDVVVTLLPVNERFPWVTPAKFRPELVPEELMAPALSVRHFQHYHEHHYQIDSYESHF